MSPPDETQLSRPQFVGARVQRLEDPRLLTGAGLYVADIKRHGMVHIPADCHEPGLPDLRPDLERQQVAGSGKF